MSFGNQAKKEGKNLLTSILALFKWVLLATVTGILVGLVGVVMVKSIGFVSDLREKHSYLICFMPVAGLIIVFLYKITGREKDSGTNAVLSAIRNSDHIHILTAPLIVVSTILTHLVGGSSGREGAALQFGGSMGEAIGNILKFDQKDRTVLIMCGMSAAFSAVFGVPLTAVIFPIEVANVGIMYYSALVPCTVSALVAHEVASFFGIKSAPYILPEVGYRNLHGIIVTVVLAVLCAVISMIFCEALHSAQHGIEKILRNKYIRIVLGSAVIIGLTFIFGTDYCGIGGGVISNAVEKGEAVPYAFLLKMVFTVLTLSIGFKGGEIVPSFFIGATFGAMLGSLLGFSPALCAALGLVAVFCGVTNCPIASLMIACELFNFNHASYFLLVVAITYLISGYRSLYKTQKIAYSKTELTYLDRDSE